MTNKNIHGFTIIELLIVIVVIGILASITVVAFGGVRARAIESEKGTKLQRIQTALELYAVQNGQYPQGNKLANQGAAGAAVIGLQLSDFEPTGYQYPGNGIESFGGIGPDVTGFKYSPTQYANGVGFQCNIGANPDNCQSYSLGYWDRVKNQAVIVTGSL